MNFSVTKNGKPLDQSKYIWDEKTKTFSSNESDLVLDFSGIDGVTFNTSSYCIFNTSSYCTFDTGWNCTFDTGSYCTFDTGWDCTFKTGSYCTFKTGSDSVLLKLVLIVLLKLVGIVLLKINKRSVWGHGEFKELAKKFFKHNLNIYRL